MSIAQIISEVTTNDQGYHRPSDEALNNLGGINLGTQAQEDWDEWLFPDGSHLFVCDDYCEEMIYHKSDDVVPVRLQDII